MTTQEDRHTLGNESTTEIPHARKPKTRAPRGFRDRLLFPGRALPSYTGPYSVGTMEIEVPVQHPQQFSSITRNKRHLLRLETVLMIIYYPAALEAHHVTTKNDQFSRQLWLGSPRLSTARGYGRFAGLPEWMVLPIFAPTVFTKLPAYRNAPLARHWAPAVDIEASDIKVKEYEGGKPEGATDQPVFPLIMFSHGLGGTRTMYSSVCGEFASYGFVVYAVEHRDGTGPRTYVNHPKSNVRGEADIDHSKVERQRGYDVVDYIFPKDNPIDTSPNSGKGVDRELRNAQLDLRAAEIEEAYKVMETLVAGDGQLIADRNLRQEDYKASSSHGLKNVNWAGWKARVRLDNVTACGHSFGAATAVNMLRQPRRWPKFTQGIIYDIWGDGAAPVDEMHPQKRIRAPLLALNSEAFTYWPSNFDVVASIIAETQASPHPAPSWFVTVRGTVHLTQSDFSLLFPRMCSLFMKMVADPGRALDLNINASLEFLSHVLPRDLAQVNRAYKNEKLLESELSPLDSIPSNLLHRPKDKFVAARLHIKHEWLYRLSHKLFRGLKRRSNKRHGRPLETGEEIWLHVKPTADDLARYLDSHCHENADERLESVLPLTVEGSDKPEHQLDLSHAKRGG